MTSVMSLIRTFTINDYRTPETILRECVADIDHGAWVCGQLFQIVNEYEGYVGRHKPRGCAMGLVAINGGVATIREEKKPNGLMTWIAREDDFSSVERWKNPNAEKALIALAQTIESVDDSSRARDHHFDWKDYGSNIDAAMKARPVSSYAADAIIEFNDDRCEGTDGAREWFTKAAEYAARNF